MEEVNDLNTNVYVIVSGPPGSGKDECVNGIREKWVGGETILNRPLVEITISDFVKRGMLDSLCMRDRLTTDWDDDKDAPREEFNGKSFRQACITYSEDYMKPLQGEDVFSNKATDYLKSINPKHSLVLMTGVGFKVEVGSLVSMVDTDRILHLIVSREGHTFKGDSREAVYIPGAIEVNIENDSGVEELRDKAEEAVARFILEKK